MVGLFAGDKPWRRAAAEESYWRCVSHGSCMHVPLFYETALPPAHLAAASAHQRFAGHPAHCCALAHFGHLAQSTLFLFFSTQRAGTIPRLSVVLLH